MTGIEVAPSFEFLGRWFSGAKLIDLSGWTFNFNF